VATTESVRTKTSYYDCTSRPDCECQFCLHDRNLPSEEDALAEDFMKRFQQEKYVKESLLDEDQEAQQVRQAERSSSRDNGEIAAA
jgi:hypothetical protein